MFWVSSVTALHVELSLTDLLPDPEVSTLTTLNNVQNALFVPDIPFLNRFYNRNPTYDLSRNPTRISEASEPEPAADRPQIARQYSRQTGQPISRQVSRQISRKPVPPTPGPPPVPDKSAEQEMRIAERGDSRTPEPDFGLHRSPSITSHVEDEHYAVLPHGVTLDGWSDEDVAALDDYVRHMLHSRRSKFKRGLRGFKKYIKKREFYHPTPVPSILTFPSSRLLRHSLRFPHHHFRLGLGTFPHRLDFTWCQKGLHHSHCRFRLGRSLCYHG